MLYSYSSYSSLPTISGVYIFLGNNSEVLYVGKARNLKARVSSYFLNSTSLGEKTRVLVSKIKKIKITAVESELEALLLESYLIKKYNPRYNIRLTDNKSYLLVRITMKDDYPKILLARRENDANSIYFGPYPNSGAVKLVLKTIRKVFPYQSVLNHSKKICLYHHLGLCPCPPVFGNSKLKREYKTNIKRIIRVFQGESKKLIRELEYKRDNESSNEDYESALVLQKKINALSVITTPHHKPFEYDLNPNLRSDIRNEELSGLIRILNTKGYLLTSLNRVECYDISNIQGTRATGSMVVFTAGEKNASHYRKFKIRMKAKPNDFAMMKEMLLRRLKHIEWEMPDLIIVDGGKGQVSSAFDVITRTGLNIPLIGLAKRDEIIVTYVDGEFKEISLPKDTPALKFMMRIRDEAHRFAITYHKKLRSKGAFN